jgi:hypothetical protein
VSISISNTVYKRVNLYKYRYDRLETSSEDGSISVSTYSQRVDYGYRIEGGLWDAMKLHFRALEQRPLSKREFARILLFFFSVLVETESPVERYSLVFDVTHF